MENNTNTLFTYKDNLYKAMATNLKVKAQEGWEDSVAYVQVYKLESKEGHVAYLEDTSVVYVRSVKEFQDKFTAIVNQEETSTVAEEVQEN